MKAGNVDASLRILVAMTAMTPLTPARLKQIADDALLKVPDDIDLSHLDDETLQRFRRFIVKDGRIGDALLYVRLRP